MIILILLTVLYWFSGNELLTMATDTAIRRGTNVWTASRPEFCCALLFYAMAFTCILIAGEL